MFHIDKILDLAVRMNNRLQDLKTRIQYLDYEVQHIKTEQRKRNAEQADLMWPRMGMLNMLANSFVNIQNAVL